MTPFPVPCPCCGGLVEKPACRCTRCGMAWAEAKEMLFDGLCGASERAVKIAEFCDWSTLASGVQAMQDVMDALSVRGKYELELEKIERMERR